MQLEPLKPGDTIELVSLSHATDTPELARRIEKGIEYYENLGFKIQIKQDLSLNHKGAADTIKNRVDALHRAVLDKNVNLVLPIRGGAYFNQLLYGIDFDLIANFPKWYGGFSDTSTLINLVASKTGLPGIHGLDVVWHISEFESFPKWLIEQHKSTLFSPHEFNFKLDCGYDLQDLQGKTLLNNFRSNNISFSGKLLGGHLGSYPALMGHRCFDDSDLILMLESTTTNEHTLKLLYGLLELGLFENVNGVILGFNEFDEENYEGSTFPNHISMFEAIEEILAIANKKYSKVIGLVKTNLFGHETKNILFPVGLNMEFDHKSSILKTI